jgi:hypothetical protein
VLDTNSRRIETQRYLYGTAHGLWEWHSTSGIALASLLFQDGEVVGWPTPPPGVRVVTDTAYRHGTGAVQWREGDTRRLAHIELVAGTLHGHFMLFYPQNEGLAADTNRVHTHGGFHFGKPHGTWRTYWPNGQLASLREYAFGQETGLWRWFNQEGKLLRSERYECGYRHGPTQLYRPGERLPHTTFHFIQDIPIGRSGE